MTKSTLILIALILGEAGLQAADWPQWGGADSRNMVSFEKGLPVDFSPGQMDKDSEQVDMATTRNCLWVVRQGSTGLVPPAVANGRIFVGTNNQPPNGARYIRQRGMVMVFEEKTGAFQWQLAPGGDLEDSPYNFIRSMATIVGDRGYVVTNLGEIVCFNTKGTASGKSGDLRPDGPAPLDPSIIWVYDMGRELGVFPPNKIVSWPPAPWPSPLVVKGKVYVATTNGVGPGPGNIPAPHAASFVCVDAETGKYVAQIPAAEKVSEHTMFCSCSSPSYAQVNGHDMIFFAASDGFVYGMGSGEERHETRKGVFELPVKLKYDAVPQEYRLKKYRDFDGPSELVGTPVIVDGKCYVAIGQSADHGDGLGMLSCIDITQTGDLSGKAVWTFKGLGRSLATPAVKDGLVYAADRGGRVFCLDAKTGEEFWRSDTMSIIEASLLVADGKVYVGTDDGDLFIFAEGRQLKELGHIEFPDAIYSPAVAANGVLYVTTQTHIYAFKEGAKPTR